MEPEGFVLSIFRYFYKRRKPTALEASKPGIKWFPKYTVPVCAIESAQESELIATLETILAPMGFEFLHSTKSQLYFARGKTWGDFSIKYMRLHLIFGKELHADATVQVEVADVCVFDTGDLWKLGGELQTRFAEFKKSQKKTVGGKVEAQLNLD